MTEGFFGPLFFVWLGVSLDLRELGQHPSLILLGLVLEPGEPAALILGALVTIAVASVSGGLAVRAGLLRAPKPDPAQPPGP